MKQVAERNDGLEQIIKRGLAAGPATQKKLVAQLRAHDVAAADEVEAAFAAAESTREQTGNEGLAVGSCSAPTAGMGAIASGEVGAKLAPTSDLGANGRTIAQRMAAEAELRQALTGWKAEPTPLDEAWDDALGEEPPGPESQEAPTAEPDPAKEVKHNIPAKAAAVSLARTLDVAAPFEVARCFVVDRYNVRGVPTLRRWRGDWLRWTGTHYAVVGRETLEAEVYGYLNEVNGGKFDPSERDVNQVIHALKSRVLLADEVEGGTWLDGDAPWGEGPIICCKNGVLGLGDRRLWPHDPRLFNLNAIETEYRPGAQAPRWMQFLEKEVWSEDHVSPNALQEFFGLVLTDETKFQKGFIIVGPARSGKGTIARVLSALLGPRNFCGPSLNQLSQQFGMQGLIGRKLAVVPDARLDNRANRSVITEKLLSIIGEDVQEINRKNREYWSGILQLRVMILSNELPDFKDDTGVIATRFVILQTMNSFLGREDPELSEKLKAELSGILNWALNGWARLAEQGKFTVPGNGELNEELSSNASAVKAFALQCCEFGDGFTVPIDTAYNAYRGWCEGNGAQSWADRLPVNQFSGKIRSAFPGKIDVIRPRDGGTRKRVFAGMRLRRHS